MKNSVKKMTKLFIMSLAIILANGTNKAYAQSGIPQVDRIVAEYAGVREGDTQTFDILSKSPCNVQYRVWLCNKKDNVWQDITKGFTPPMQPKSIYSVTTPKLKEGQYTISVWVKRYGASKTVDKRGFHSYLATNMNCLKDDGKGSYLSIDNFTHNYEVGQTISISNKNGKDYLYNYNVYDLINRRNVVTSEAYRDEVSWKPGKEGLYLLKVNIKSIEKIPVVVQKSDEMKDNVDDNKEDSKNNVIKNNDNINKEIIKDNKEENKDKSLKNENDKKDVDSEKQVEDKDIINNKDNVIPKYKENNDDKKDNKQELGENKKEEIQYKEVEKNTTAFKLIAVGNPYRELIKPTVTPSTSRHSNAIHVKSLVVGNASEGQIIYIKSSPSQGASNIGYFYGSLQGIDILKTVGNYYYIETKDYKSLNNVRGYVLKSQLKIVTPNQTYSITVKLGQQKVYIYKGDSLIKTFTCSTGMDSTPTPTGVYLVGTRGSLFYSGSSVICYNWVRWNNNFLFHSVLYDRNGNLILSEYKKLGQKASHGCIRLPLGDVRWIYDNIPSGTPVIIQR
ncbi:murein L,D-transpeptidase [Clostridium botulinum]|uniref:L,D-transpeptidase n=1 Tax=Clostridium botulinum TaxID=1491 RepID=UPI00052DA72F|nr:L,D-transpeptidase [Clostridium botulinum]KGM93519.1 hypothetical protein Z956_11640 [Clostridium botulinum D str. CCUG 7971]KOC49230.1 hypothetical protein ADU88_06890 [Clostridium botulinum]NFO97135.1 murein L,D-transpeptidase [Clostridium botulinum]OOV51955.1 L,D-transpeptidase [Clostridium botulinum D/C]OOV55099.1 L,D-transpeptidase [Clostridium botulinum D/C]